MSKLPIMITTDSVCDLPRDLAAQYQIKILPYFVVTDHGRFLDQTEIGGPDLVDYMRKGNFAKSSRPNVEEYRNFFKENLQKADRILHIAMGRGSSSGYTNASIAAGELEGVKVFDSRHLSSSMGMVAIRAAELARLGLSVDEIVAYLEKYVHQVSSCFLVNDIEYLYRAKRMPKSVRNLSYRFMFRPIFHMKKGTISLKGIMFGSWKHVVRKYIAKALRHAWNADTTRVFVTHVNLNQETLEAIAEEILKHVSFKEIIFIDATAAISCNCGSGTVGVLYAKKMPLPNQSGTGEQSEKSQQLKSVAQTDLIQETESVQETGTVSQTESEAQIKSEAQTEFAAQPGKIEDSDTTLRTDINAPADAANQLDDQDILQKLDFLDWRSGMLFVANNVDLYVEILKEFIHDDREQRLTGFLEAKKWEDYRILVHSLKSASRTIGIEDLSEEARLLEFACKDGNYEYVEENHGAVMEHFRQYCSKIGNVVD